MTKLLPLLLLLSFTCHGQTGYWNGDTTEKVNFYIGEYPVWSSNDSIEPKTYWIPQPSLEEKLLQYAEECYNDSTRYCYYTLCDIECCDVSCECGTSVPGFIDIPCLEKYIHRKPTFEGFIEWLRQK